MSHEIKWTDSARNPETTERKLLGQYPENSSSEVSAGFKQVTRKASKTPSLSASFVLNHFGLIL